MLVGKKIFFKDQAKQQLLAGILELTNAVQITLGPCGRNVVLEKTYGVPVITKDGVTVAKEITLKNRVQNIGAQLLKEVASKTADVAGDGTTTATVLAKSIIFEGHKCVVAGMDPIELKKGIEKASQFVVSKLYENAIPCVDDLSIKQVGMISANHDENIGSIIAEAIQKVGKEGVITVESGNGLIDELVIVEGLQFDRGYISPYFANSKNNTVCELDNPVLFITDKKLTSMRDLLPVLEAVAKAGRSLFIIAEDVDGEALATLVINGVRGLLKVCAAKAPGFGDRRRDLLDDIAILTGTSVISDEQGVSLQSVSFESLGSAKKIICTKEHTILIGNLNNRSAIDDRIAQLRSLKKDATSDYDKEKIQERIAKFSGGVAVIKVGGATEIEMTEKKFRIEDALHATRAAIDEGVLPGGGVTYVKIANLLDEVLCENNEQQQGVLIVKKALAVPLKQIAANGGHEVAVVLETVKKSKDFNYGFNAALGVYGSMLSFGVLDPVKVVRCALQNAVSIACLFIITECVIVDNPEKKFFSRKNNQSGNVSSPYADQFSNNEDF